jgi:hypothetical protein
MNCKSLPSINSARRRPLQKELSEEIIKDENR